MVYPGPNPESLDGVVEDPAGQLPAGFRQADEHRGPVDHVGEAARLPGVDRVDHPVVLGNPVDDDLVQGDVSLGPGVLPLVRVLPHVLIGQD